MKVEYVQGRDVCERCGTSIKHIFIITFNDGFTLKCGSECVKKALADTNLKEAGKKYFLKKMKDIQYFEEAKAKWSARTYESAEAEGINDRWDSAKNCWIHWTKEQFEEKKKFYIEKFYPYQIEQTHAEMEKKLARVKIRH